MLKKRPFCTPAREVTGAVGSEENWGSPGRTSNLIGRHYPLFSLEVSRSSGAGDCAISGLHPLLSCVCMAALRLGVCGSQRGLLWAPAAAKRRACLLQDADRHPKSPRPC